MDWRRYDLIGTLIALSLAMVIISIFTKKSAQWFEDSTSYQPHMQDFQLKVLRILQYVSDIVYLFGLVPVVLFAYPSQRPKLMYYILIWVVGTVVEKVQKIAYHEARPSWVNTEVVAPTCNTEFGNPSGHALHSFVFACCLWVDIAKFYEKQITSNKICR